MKIVVLTDKPYDSPTAWWRVLRPLEALRNHNIDASHCWLKADQTPQLSVKDAYVILHRTVSSNAKAWVQSLRDQGAIKVIYELDDNTITDDYCQYMIDCGRMSQNILDTLDKEIYNQIETIAECDEVRVSTLELKHVVSKVFSGTIRVVPNSIDVEWFQNRLSKTRIDNSPTIGWAGGLRPDYDLADMAKAWGIVAKKYKRVKFVSAGFQHNVIYESVPFDRIIRIPSVSLEYWPKSMQVDIGCCSMVNNNFNRCKSPIKSYEYGIAGACVVSSGVIYNTPFMCRSVDEWVSVLSELVEDPDMRVRWANIHKNIVQGKYSLATNWFDWMPL